jgi:hypothetical protein
VIRRRRNTYLLDAELAVEALARLAAETEQLATEIRELVDAVAKSVQTQTPRPAPKPKPIDTRTPSGKPLNR